MNDPYPSLHQTVRVAADGTVTHGIEVPLMSRTPRALASSPHVVGGLRYAPNRMPAGIDLKTTAPHDCRNHLREFESESDEAARLMLDLPATAPVAA